MRAAISYEAGKPLVIEKITIQPPKENEIRIKVSSCAICQSDQHYLSGAWSGLPFAVIELPLKNKVVSVNFSSWTKLTLNSPIIDSRMLLSKIWILTVSLSIFFIINFCSS